tara:strand:+ start:206 stop:430 length:225 start_codon:yes stop_codon:yes gene_type:complete
MGCGCGKNKKKMKSSRMPVNENSTKIKLPTKNLTPNQRRSKIVKMNNARNKTLLTKNQKKQEEAQRLWKKYREK